MNNIKPGYKTSEFWITAAVTLFSGLVTAGIIPEDNQYVRAASSIAMIVAPAAYAASRGQAKRPA